MAGLLPLWHGGFERLVFVFPLFSIHRSRTLDGISGDSKPAEHFEVIRVFELAD